MPLTFDTPELRRLAVENAWRFEVELLEIECWGGSEFPGVYTARLPGDGRRLGPASWMENGEFVVPGSAAELPGVVEDERLGGRVHMAARRICGVG